MSTWADAVGMTEPDPFDREGVPEALTAMRTRIATAAAAVALERARAEDAEDGFPAEPPLTVLRVRTTPDSSLQAARCVNGGWWWVSRDQEGGIPPTGWQWSPKHIGRHVTSWVNVTRPSDRARFGPIRAYRFHDTEPPPGVVRLRQHPPTDTPDMEVARCVDGGWHWAAPGEVPCRSGGWPWGEGELSSDDTVLLPVRPELDRDDDAELLDTLGRALPADGNWYWVAIDADTRWRIWGRLDEDGDDLQFLVQDENPDVF